MELSQGYFNEDSNVWQSNSSSVLVLSYTDNFIVLYSIYSCVLTKTDIMHHMEGFFERI